MLGVDGFVVNGWGDEYVRLVLNVGNVNGGALVVLVNFGVCASVEGGNVVALVVVLVNTALDVMLSGEYVAVVSILWSIFKPKIQSNINYYCK